LATDTETAAAISSHNTAANGHTTRGDTAGRPASPTVGDVYKNTQTGNVEVYESTGWIAVGISPDAPTSVTATNQGSSRSYNNGQASVAFSAGTVTGSSYTITSSPGSYTASGASSPIAVTGLQSGTEYTYTAIATNKYGTSSASSASSGVTATTVPQAPTIGTATGGSESATLTFTAGATGGSSITNYKYSTDNSTYTAFSPAQTTSPLTISGLTDGTAYSFYLKAVNTNGDSAASAASNSVTPANPSSYESIATVTVGSGGSANVEFTSIPATYTHLQIRGIGQSSRTGTNRSDLLVKFNGSSTGYAYHYLQGNGSAAAAAGASSQTYGTVVSNAIPAQDYTSQFGAVVIDILDYANTNKNTTLRGLGGTDNNGAGAIALGSTLWNNTAAITSIELTIDGAYNFKQYSQFALYGIKGA
jgi:hypothetical protein